jgi:hypothetical protein
MTTAVPDLNMMLATRISRGGIEINVFDTTRSTKAIRIQRRHMDGKLYTLRATPVGPTYSSQMWSSTPLHYQVYDYEVPLGLGAEWRAQYQYLDGSWGRWSSYANWGIASDYTLLLSDPLNEGTELELNLEFADITSSYTRAQGVYVPLRGDRHVVMSGPLLGAEVEFTAVTEWASHVYGIREWLASGRTLLVRSAGYYLYATAGDMEVVQVATGSFKPLYRVTLRFTEVARP